MPCIRLKISGERVSNLQESTWLIWGTFGKMRNPYIIYMNMYKKIKSLPNEPVKV